MPKIHEGQKCCPAIPVNALRIGWVEAAIKEEK